MILAQPQAQPDEPPASLAVVTPQVLPEELAASTAVINPQNWVDPNTEDGNALLFLRRFGVDWRYCAQHGKWYGWDDLRWKPDHTNHINYLIRTACLASASRAKDNPKQKAKLSSAATFAAVERISRTDPALTALSDDWDADLMLLNTPIGVIDLHIGTVLPHDPDYMMTKITTASPQGECPRWMQFLMEVTGNDEELISYLQRIVGYALTGLVTEDAIFFLYGTGRNGKSVFIHIIMVILGDYATVASMETFMAARGERHPTDMAGLQGARIVSATETKQGARWDEAKIKALTGGDLITARFMRQDFFTYMPQFKLFIAGNHKPVIENVDLSMRRRMHLIPFTVTIPMEKIDKNLDDKLLAERDGIMAWALQGCLDWQAHGLMPPKAVTQATEEYFESEDIIGQWLDEQCDLDQGLRTPISKLFAAWSSWAAARGEYTGKQRWLSEILINRGFVRTRMTAGVHGLIGLALKPSSIKSAYDFN